MVIRSLTDIAVRRFWPKVHKTETCWLWAGAKDQHGYGVLRVNGPPMRATRFLWTVLYGPIQGRLEVCHHCDTPSCVRPEHLFLATHEENMLDSVRKDRHAGIKKIRANSYRANARRPLRLSPGRLIDI